MIEVCDSVPRAEVPHFDYEGVDTLVLPELDIQEPVSEHIIDKLGRGATETFYDYEDELQPVLLDYDEA